MTPAEIDALIARLRTEGAWAIAPQAADALAALARENATILKDAIEIGKDIIALRATKERQAQEIARLQVSLHAYAMNDDHATRELDALREVLQFYANETNYLDGIIKRDMGTKACAALARENAAFRETEKMLWQRIDNADRLIDRAEAENARLDDVEGLAVALVARAERAEAECAELRKALQSAGCALQKMEGGAFEAMGRAQASIDAALAAKEKE